MPTAHHHQLPPLHHRLRHGRSLAVVIDDCFPAVVVLVCVAVVAVCMLQVATKLNQSWQRVKTCLTCQKGSGKRGAANCELQQRKSALETRVQQIRCPAALLSLLSRSLPLPHFSMHLVACCVPQISCRAG